MERKYLPAQRSFEIRICKDALVFLSLKIKQKPVFFYISGSKYSKNCFAISNAILGGFSIFDHTKNINI